MDYSISRARQTMRDLTALARAYPGAQVSQTTNPTPPRTPAEHAQGTPTGIGNLAKELGPKSPGRAPPRPIYYRIHAKELEPSGTERRRNKKPGSNFPRGDANEQRWPPRDAGPPRDYIKDRSYPGADQPGDRRTRAAARTGTGGKRCGLTRPNTPRGPPPYRRHDMVSGANTTRPTTFPPGQGRPALQPNGRGGRGNDT